jgi:hypothetical protein
VKKYLLYVTVFSTIWIVAYWVLDQSILAGKLHNGFPLLVFFFYLQSLPLVWILKLVEKNDTSSPILIMASIGFRLITGLFLLLILYALKVPDLNSLAIQFAGLYLVYLMFELTLVLANLRRNWQ